MAHKSKDRLTIAEFPFPNNGSDAHIWSVGPDAVLYTDGMNLQGVDLSTHVVFRNYAAVRHTPEPQCGGVDHLDSYDAVTVLTESKWLAEFNEGSAEQSKKREELRHFALYLDSPGYYEALAPAVKMETNWFAKGAAPEEDELDSLNSPDWWADAPDFVVRIAETGNGPRLIRFVGTRVYEITTDEWCSEAQRLHAGRPVEIQESEWIRRIDAQSKKRGRDRFVMRHFCLYCPGDGFVEVISRDFVDSGD